MQQAKSRNTRLVWLPAASPKFMVLITMKLLLQLPNLPPSALFLPLQHAMTGTSTCLTSTAHTSMVNWMKERKSTWSSHPVMRLQIGVHLCGDCARHYMGSSRVGGAGTKPSAVLWLNWD